MIGPERNLIGLTPVIGVMEYWSLGMMGLCGINIFGFRFKGYTASIVITGI